jgi:hypothetical protein
LKISGLSIILILLASALVIPVGVSYGAYGGSEAFNPPSATKSNQTMTPVNQTQNMGNQTMTNMTGNMSPTNSTNKTATPVKILTETLSLNQTMKQSSLLLNKTKNQNNTNATLSSSTVNDTKAAQGISDFVHQAVTNFAKQKTETRQAMLDCRDKIVASNPSNIDKILSDCKVQLDTITQKYQSDRKQYHDDMLKYRDSVMTFTRDAKGIKVEKAEMDKAFAEIITRMHQMMSGGMFGGTVVTTTPGSTNQTSPYDKLTKAVPTDRTHPMMPIGNMTGMPGKGFMATKNNTKCVNPPGGPAIC